MTDRYEKNLKALSHEIWAAAQLAPGEGIVDGVARVEAMLRKAAHPAITHCEECGCDWLDNGLNPVGCPYCKQSVEIEALRAELDESCAVMDKLARLLSETAIVIKGPEPDMMMWGYNDIPDGVRAIQARAERLAEALAGLITWIPSADTYRRFGFDPATPMQALMKAKTVLREEGKQ